MKLLLLVLLAIAAMPAAAALKVFATVPEWGALAREIGGDRVQVFTATTALQDAHHVDARPSLIARARSADLLIATGADLEVGWLPVVQRESGNPRIQSGQPGYFEAAQHVRMLEVPGRLDRADGDVHADGNPHIQTDPRHFLAIGEALAARLALLDPSNAAVYRSGHAAFAERWRAQIKRWEAQAAPLKGVAVVSQHKAWPYLYDWLGMREVAALEPKPGVEPLAGPSGPGARPGGDQPPAHGDPCRLQLGATRGMVREGGQGAGRGAPVHGRCAGGGRPDGAVRHHGAAPAQGLGDMTLAATDPGLLAAPFAAGLVVLATHVPLGITVLRRGIIFIDLAVAQVAALGVIVAGLAHLDEWWGGFGTQLAAGIAALGAAALLTFCERRWPEIQEALIGLLFVFAAAAGILLLAGNPQGGEHLRDLLAGQILWTGWGQIGIVAALSAAVLAGRAWLARRGGGEGLAFYALFAVAVTASVQLVGVLLVFASLIAPAVATRAFGGWRQVVVAYLAGAAGYAAGLAFSLCVDLPAGATVVCCLCLLALSGLAFFRREAGELY
jgi:zinc/manganese transport system substrate-binding protein